MWQLLDFPQTSEEYPQTKKLLDALSDGFAVHEPYFHGTFRIPEHPMLLSYLRNDQVVESDFFEKFWLTPSVNKIGRFEITELNPSSERRFKKKSPFLLSGYLSWALAVGGMYNCGKPEDGGVQLRNLGDAAADELIHGNYNDIRFYLSYDAWCSFFYDCGWDKTWIVFDLSKMIVHVILTTVAD